MKHGNKFFLQLTRELFTEEYASLSTNAKWLFVVLNELEQRFSSDKRDFFYRSNNDLAQDCGFSISTLKRAKAELLKTNLIQTWQAHWLNADDKLSKKHVSAYRILK